MNRRRRSGGQAGVTLIELLVVVVIIGLFVALVGPSLWRNADKAKVTVARSQIENFMTALGAYKLDVGTFPTTEQGLQALRVSPGDVAQWAGPYMPKDIPKDPWGHDYVLKIPGPNGLPFEILSLGADGAEGGQAADADLSTAK